MGTRWGTDRVREETLRVAGELIAIESHGECDQQESAVVEWIAGYLEDAGYAAERDEIAPGRPNILARRPDADPTKPVVCLAGHTDTVPAYTMPDAFTPRVEGDTLRGRGAVDMKGGIANQLVALRVLSEEGIDLPYAAHFLGLVDEEQRALGGRRIADAGAYTADFAIVAEPTSLKVMRAHRGMEWTQVAFRGLAAHGSSPHEGRNANLAAARFVDLLDTTLRPALATREHALLGPATVNAGVIRGGSTPNMVSDECVVEIDCRYLPGEDQASVEAAYADLLREPAIADLGVAASITRMDWGCGRHQPLDTPADHWGITGLLASVAAVRPDQRHEAGAFPGWSDAAQLSELGIRGAVFGPGSIALAHSADERIAIDELAAGTEILLHFLSGGQR